MLDLIGTDDSEFHESHLKTEVKAACLLDQDHRLSVQDAAAVLAHTQSRATSGSRTDGSTDDECVVVVTHSGERAPPSSGRRRSSGRQSDGVCESRRLSRNDACRGQKPRRSSKNMVQEAGNHASHHDQRSTISRSHSAGGSERQGASKVNRNINRFSNFVKSGMEAYVLGESRMNGQPGEKHEVVISGPLVQWRPIQQYYTCTVDKPKKETKLKGLKSFIAYSLTSTLSRIQVSRRYKHFDWLHDQLSAKYIMIAIPPLPEKQVSGRYEDDLIDHRKHILQLWVNKICRHPVLSQSEVWLHFITCTDEKEWKNGKRKAEKLLKPIGRRWHWRLSHWHTHSTQMIIQQAIQKYRENECKLSHADAERIKRRVDSTSYAIEDVRVTMHTYLKRQADFYQKMANTLNEMAKLYEF
ncbi:PX domain protein [Teladorsagia circumcincta]|uniref:PX domain protein n=1 Tax=Teladorsagia circumcincta TaxID=45464 RepID=A0A2G9U3N5_TELCI|nr:PX domain protein [Teladorsagia circumcincta]